MTDAPGPAEKELDLQAIERIKQLKGAYYIAIDCCDLATLRDKIFTPDATLKLYSPAYTYEVAGWPELEAFFRDNFTARRFGMHQGHHGTIDVDGDHASGTWYLHDIYINQDSGKLIQGSALYRDEYVKVNGVWKVKATGYTRMLDTIQPIPSDLQIVAAPTVPWRKPD